MRQCNADSNGKERFHGCLLFYRSGTSNAFPYGFSRLWCLHRFETASMRFQTGGALSLNVNRHVECSGRMNMMDEEEETHECVP